MDREQVEAYLEGESDSIDDSVDTKQESVLDTRSFYPKVFSMPFDLKEPVEIMIDEVESRGDSLEDNRFSVDLDDQRIWVDVSVAEFVFGEELRGKADRLKTLLSDKSLVDWEPNVEESQGSFIFSAR